jgi:hypothetical protein
MLDTLKKKAILAVAIAALALAGVYFPDFGPVFTAAAHAISALLGG